jgi:hypothetical protein
MIVSDILVDLRNSLQKQEDASLYRMINQGISLLSNMGGGRWNSLTGYMTIAITGDTIVLPRDVLVPISINIDNNVTFPRDRWFEFHINGSGGGDNGKSLRAWDDRGSVVTFKELSQICKIQAVIEGNSDDSKKIIISGTDADDREISETLTLSFASPPVTTLSFNTISYVHKDVTAKSVKLYEYTTTQGQNVGWYYPDEVIPEYRKIRVGGGRVANIIYKRRTNKVSSIYDYIPIDNSLAVIQAVRSVDYRLKSDFDKADRCEKDANKLLEEEEYARMIDSPVAPQILNFSSYNEERLRSGDISWM